MSTHDAAAGADPPVPAGSTLDPQAVRARPRDRNTAVTAVLRMRGVVTPGASRFARQGEMAARRVPGCLRAARQCSAAGLRRPVRVNAKKWVLRTRACCVTGGLPRTGRPPDRRNLPDTARFGSVIRRRRLAAPGSGYRRPRRLADLVAGQSSVRGRDRFWEDAATSAGTRRSCQVVRQGRTSSQSVTCRYQAQRVTGRGCATPSWTTVAGRQPTWTARPTAAPRPARAAGGTGRRSAVGERAPAARPHGEAGGSGLGDPAGRRRRVRPGRHNQPPRRPAQHQQPVAVRLAVHRSGGATDLPAAHQHATRVVAHQRRRPCDAGAGQFDGRRPAGQPPEARRRRPVVGGNVGQLDVEAVAAQQAHEHGGEVGVGAGDDEPAHRTGQQRVDVGTPGPRGHGDRPEAGPVIAARWRYCTGIGAGPPCCNTRTGVAHVGRIIDAGQEHHARVVVPHVIRYPSLPAPRRTGAP